MSGLVELLRLVGRAQLRARPGASRADQAGSMLVVRVVLLAVVAFQGWRAGEVVDPSTGAEQLGWVVIGLALISLGAGALVAQPLFRSVHPVLRHPLLASLPVPEGARTVAELTSLYVVYVAAGVAGFAAAGIAGVLYPVGIAVAFAVFGNGAVRVARCLGAGRSPGALRAAPFGAVVVGYLLVSLKTVLAQRGAALAPLGRGLLRGGDLTSVLVVLLVLGVSVFGIYVAERRGYDKVDITPSTKFEAAAPEELHLDTVAELLVRRERGVIAYWLALVTSVFIVFGVFFVLVSVLRSGRAPEDAEALVVTLTKGVLLNVVFFAAFTTLGVARRFAERDMTARPLLAPLPIAPRDLLRGRVRLVRRQSLAVLFPLVAFSLLPVSASVRVGIMWRTGLLFVVTWLVAETLAYVTFLSSGLATAKRSRSSLANYLVLFPIPAVVVADSPVRAILPLVFAWLTAREARIACHGAVRWLDDEAEGERALADAPWRALVVFGAFAACQGLIITSLRAILGPGRELVAMLGGLLAAGLLLLGLTASGYELRGVLGRPRHALRGVVLGVLSASVALATGEVFRRFELAPPTPEGVKSALGVAALVVVVPIAEEAFFRGWLLTTLFKRVAPSDGRFASLGPILLGALLFTLVHPLESFVPVFVLGVCTGYLRRATGGIVAGCVAHAIHNGAVLFFAG